jgi:Hemerythrin HHE cation binding domain
LATATSTEVNNAPPKEGMFRELLYIHSLLRRDLQTVRRLANDARDGRSPEAILSEIRELETNSPLWRLKFGCMYYCRFVHGHHTLEDAMLFPMVRKQDPSLNKIVDRLEEDHLKVHHITERIVALAEEVPTDASGATRDALVEALTDLEENLLAHLALEEESIGPLLSTWDHWPVE